MILQLLNEEDMLTTDMANEVATFCELISTNLDEQVFT
jgi:hypothetical protein